MIEAPIAGWLLFAPVDGLPGNCNFFSRVGLFIFDTALEQT